MQEKPNILFLMNDQVGAHVLRPDCPGRTPNLDRIAARGVRFDKAYTPSPVCTPARASLMTGLMPHNHGAVSVHLCGDGTGDWGMTPPDEAPLRPEKRHWAQQLFRDGYITGYYGKWHVDYWHNVNRYGWGRNGLGVRRLEPLDGLELAFQAPHPRKGYGNVQGGQIVDNPPEERSEGLDTEEAKRFLDWALPSGLPWCCFLSFAGPHSAKLCTRETYESYDLEDMDLPPNLDHPLDDRPEIFRIAKETWSNMTERDHRAVRAAYYASIEDQDKLFGSIIDKIEAAGQLDNTIIIYCSDHGEALGNHGLYTKMYLTHEAAYNIPLVMCGPGIPQQGQVSDARVGLQDLCPTLLELVGAPGIDNPIDARSFAPLLRGEESPDQWRTGFAQSHGTQHLHISRLYWEGDWKLCFNTFGKSELYNLAEDPWEMTNRIDDPECREILEHMARGLYSEVRRTDDKDFLRPGAPLMRILPLGQGILEE